MSQDRIFIYNAPYPAEYDEPHVIFKKFTFHNEYDSSPRRQGLPGLCNIYFYPVAPCAIPNRLVPIRKCENIGSAEWGWPRVHYDWIPENVATVEKLQSMLGTSFVSCTAEGDSEYKGKIGRRSPILPNMRIRGGYDSVSNTACLKLNFNGTVEPLWLGKEDRGETIDIYLERLPAIPF